MACSIKLTDSQEGQLVLEVINSDFGTQLYKYYQGLAEDPGINFLVSSISDKMIPEYFRDYKIKDLVDFLHDGDNVNALTSAVSRAMRQLASVRLKTIGDPDYYTNPNKILDALRTYADNQYQGEVKDAENIEATKGSEDLSAQGLPIMENVVASDGYVDYFNQRKYKDIQAYREDRFKGSAATETLLLSKFINDGLIKNVYINTSLGKGKGLVSQVQEPGRPSDIDQNLKKYRKSLLNDLLNRLEVNGAVNGVPVRLALTDDLLQPDKFQDVLNQIEGKVMNVKYKGELQSLDKEGLLTEIVNEYRRADTGKPKEELKSILDNYVDYLMLSDFDKLIDYYGQGSLHINKNQGDFDENQRKYSTQDITSVEAINAAWKEQIQNGIDFSSDLYKMLVSVTPQLSYITGQPTGEYMYPAAIAESFSRYYDNLDFEDSHNSIKQWLMHGITDPSNSFTNKNALYTIYKSFFEEEGDNMPLHKKNTNSTISSFANALYGNEDKSLMNLIAMPMEQNVKVYYAEASDDNGAPAIVLANTRGNTSTMGVLRDDITRAVNLDADKLSKLIDKFQIKFDPESITFTDGTEGATERYTLTSQGAKQYSMAAITDLSKALLDIDFDNNPAHKEFKAELQSGSDDNDQLSNNYLVFMNDALRIAEARQGLSDPETAKEIQEKKLDAKVDNQILKGLIATGKINYTDLMETQIPLSNANATEIYNMLYQSENRYTGNRIRNTVMTLENTTVAGFSVPTYFLTIKNNHNKVRNTLNNLTGYNLNRQVLGNNMFINDPRILERFNIRGATKVGSIVKSNSSMNELETMSYNVSLGYFDLLNRAIKDRSEIRAMFDITTYSDKGTNPLPLINNVYTPTNGESVKLFVDNGVAVHENVTRDLHFETNAHYYRAYANNIVDTWQAIYNAIGGEAKAKFDEVMKGKAKPSERLKAINAINGGVDGGLGFFMDPANKFEHGLVGFQAARYYADKAGVTLNNWVHFQNSAKSINNTQVGLTVKPELINYTKLYDTNDKDNYLDYMHGRMKAMIKRMKEIGFSIKGPAAEGIAQLYPTMSNNFKNPLGGYNLTRFGSEDIQDINPAMRKYFWDWNLVSENLMNSSLGPIYAHKGKDEFGMWVTQVKRNVAATASVRKYVLGLVDGVENSTKVAFVDDLVTNLKTILSEKEPVVDMDGASLESMTMRLKTWNSLNSKFNGNGGMDHKSFISHFNPNTGEFGETKHAAFAMDYDMIRNSMGSDIDLFELHKKIYNTDISKVDITKSWNGRDLSSFKDHYYWERTYDFDNNLAGHIFRLDSIVYKGKDSTGNSLYDITKANLTLGGESYTLPNQRIKTFFDLWHALGHIDSVSLSETKTNITAESGKDLLYFKPSISSAERLLDFETYIGNADDKILPADRIRRNTSGDIAAWKAYGQMFNTDGVVTSHIDLLRKAYNMDPSNLEQVNELSDELNKHDVKLGAFNFIQAAKANQNIFEKFFDTLLKDNTDGKLQFNGYSKPYQRFKGQNIDRISFAGAQKVGQFNMNDASTLSAKKLAEFKYTGEGELRNDHQVGDKVTYNGKPHFVEGVNPNEIGNTQEPDGGAPDSFQRTTELGDKLYNLSGPNGLVEGVSGKDIQAENAGQLPAIPGINQLMSHQISNYNAGIQLNAWHEADEATVTAPTQMLNALIFRAFSLDDAADIYDAIGNIVDEGLTYQLRDEVTGGNRSLNVPQLVSDLSNAEFYAQNKDQLLRIFKDLLDESMSAGDGFTLEDLIVKTFNHMNIPVDDPQIFNSAVADLANYFSKSGIRTNFDGMFSVLTPSSRMMQMHEVKGGRLPVKTQHGLDYKKLPANEVTVLNRFDYEQWKALREHVSNNPHKYDNYGLGEDMSGGMPRDLKGQQVMITYADGTTQELSALRTGQQHLIPEAEALSTISKLVSGTVKSTFSDDYKKLNNTQKLQAIDASYADFKAKFNQLVTANPAVNHAFEQFLARYNAANPTMTETGENLLDTLYDTMSKTKSFRDIKNARVREGSSDLVMSKEYELQDRVNLAGKMFLGELQNFLHEASMNNHIPASLKNSALFKATGDINGAKISVSRAEALAPMTAKTKFRFREGDTINEASVDFFHKRLLEDVDYLDVDADAVLLSNYGKKIFLHNGKADKSVAESGNIVVVNGRKWYTDDSGNHLFEIPKDVFTATQGGAIHMYLNGKYDITADNQITRNVSAAFKGTGERFDTYGLSKDPEVKAQQRIEADAIMLKRAKAMYASWQTYMDIIGTRIPGQHFQSFQGMKIVGFTEGNKIYVPNEVTLLSGSDFDIDKQNIIYYSVKDDGTVATWHPASKNDTYENLQKSLRLPMQSNKPAEYFVTARGPQGEALDKILHIDDNVDMTNLDTLLHVYGAIRNGFKIDEKVNPQVLDSLLNYERARNEGGINAVKNFAVQKTNDIINNPSNFTLLSKQVTMDTPALFAENSEKAATAKLGRRELPTAIVDQKLSNMVGKSVIGIMAAGGLKTYSAVSFSYNNDLKLAETKLAHINVLSAQLEKLQADPNASADLVTQYKNMINDSKNDLERNVFSRLKVKNDMKALYDSLTGNKLDTVANLNYRNLSPALIYAYYSSIGYDPAMLSTNAQDEAYKQGPVTFKNHMELSNMFEDDAAEVISQLLSAATDNAKELILNKINANPDLAGVYSALLMYGTPFETIVDLVNSPLADLVIKKGNSNIFDSATSDNSIKDLVGILNRLPGLMSDEKTKQQMNDLANVLSRKYDIAVLNREEFRDEVSGKTYKFADAVNLSKALLVSDELRTLSKALSINQGVKSNTWDLYNFKRTLENYVSKTISAAEQSSFQFDLKTFLDSLANGGNYHTEVTNRLNSAPAAINILHVVTSNPHFAKQLTAYNAANTILNLSSYKVKIVPKVEEKLESLGVFRKNTKLSKPHFQEIERFIDNTILENFIFSETNNNKNKNTRPIFYDGDKELRLTDRDGQSAFADWFRDKLLPMIKDMSALKANDFVNGLTIKSKYDKLLNDKYKFVALSMDTTNVKSIQQQEYRDSYVYNLKQIYDRNLTDGQNLESPDKNNNIFNALFWYNLILNKNNITKNSYAKLLGEVMKLDNAKDNPYARLLELKGNIGKSDDNTAEQSTYRLTSNGVVFDMVDLLANYDFGESIRTGSRPRGENEYNMDDNDSYDDYDYNEDYGSNDDSAQYSTEEESEPEDTEYNPDYDELQSREAKIPEAEITKTRTYGETGTQVRIKLLGQVAFNRKIELPYSLIPHGGENRSKRTYITNYNPLLNTSENVTDMDVVNYQKMMNSTMYDLLTKLSGDISVNIVQLDAEGKEIMSKFDPTKEYNCL